MLTKCLIQLRAIGSWVLAASLFFLPVTAGANGPITLFAAASVAPVLGDLSKKFSREKGIKIRISAAASSVLARQVASGAPAHIVVLANPDWMQWLQERELIVSSSRQNLMGNRLALLQHVRSDLPEGLKEALAVALNEGRIAMADPDHVPAGLYGKAALETLGLWPQVEPVLARSANAPAAVALLARGEVSAAISYKTDARLSDRIKVQSVFPEHLHPPIRYQIAMVANDEKASTSPARKFFEFLVHADRRATFTAAGFTAQVSP